MKTLMALLVLVLSVAFTSCVAVAQSTDSAFITKTYFPAVTLLYAQADDGAMKMRCTATAFEKVDAGYLFASAAHCATEMGEQETEKAQSRSLLCRQME